MSPRPSASPGPWFFPWWIELVSPLFASRSTSTRLLLAGLCGLALLAPGDAVRAELRGHGGFVTGIAVTPPGDRAVYARFGIGRASCRERRCPYGEISVGAVSLKKKTELQRSKQ